MGESSHEITEAWVEYKSVRECKIPNFLDSKVMSATGLFVFLPFHPFSYSFQPFPREEAPKSHE